MKRRIGYEIVKLDDKNTTFTTHIIGFGHHSFGIYIPKTVINTLNLDKKRKRIIVTISTEVRK